ncbi:phosphatidylinositol-specific phospholipase C domain-containing protein [Streptomyces sp. NPDC127051]|uniref:phosphatidylinositol-specific phospholipase C domain-containing protein n=1 Tax=Streptomyces sp. NPDC127051 TaxID=3347119 RepID=UPI0036673279
MTIPGTHESCARYGGLAVACQALTLPEQFDKGVRFIDIRCNLKNGEFHIYHGPFDQRITFASVLDQCQEFLKKTAVKLS